LKVAGLENKIVGRGQLSDKWRLFMSGVGLYDTSVEDEEIIVGRIEAAGRNCVSRVVAWMRSESSMLLELMSRFGLDKWN
jgi:hypothetical protein